jgi:DNA-binding NtrC family response regulator
VATAHDHGADAGPEVDPTAAAVSAARLAPDRLSLRVAKQVFERAFILEVLRQERGNVTRSAKALGLSRVMLHQKMRTLGLR